MASAFILGIILIFSSRDWRKTITRQSLPALLFTGAILGLTNYLYYLSVSYISASLAIVILMQFTWLSLLIEWVVFRKKPSAIEIGTVFLILLGTLLASNILALDSTSQSWVGVGIVTLSSVTYSLYIVLNSRMGKSIHWLPQKHPHHGRIGYRHSIYPR